MKRALTLLILTSSLAFGQNDKDEDSSNLIRKGLLRAQGTISPAWTFSNTNTNIYLQGDLEFFASRRVSIKGDIAYFINTQGGGNLKQNHSLFFGAQYHFPYKRFDPYIGFHPGVSLIQVQRSNFSVNDFDFPIGTSKAKIAPTVSVSAGFNFYVWKYFHFLANVKYVHARHPTEWGTNFTLNEIRLAIGLGWNLNLLKKR